MHHLQRIQRMCFEGTVRPPGSVITRGYSSSSRRLDPSPPRSRDRGPTSDEDTQTDFGQLNVLGNIPLPASAIDACLPNGFQLSNGAHIANAGMMLVGGEVFKWWPWTRGSENQHLLNSKGLWEVPGHALGVLETVWPKPGA